MNIKRLEVSTKKDQNQIRILDPNRAFTHSGAKKISKHGTIIIGRVQQAEIHIGDTIIISGYRLDISDKIKTIEISGDRVKSAKPGDLVGICLSNTLLDDLANL